MGWPMTASASAWCSSAGATPAEVLRTVRREFRERYDMFWLGPLGFENSYELAVPRAVAERRGGVSGATRGGAGWAAKPR